MRSLVAGLTVLALGCGSTDAPEEVVVYTSVDQVFSEPVFRYCEQATHLKVRAVFDTEETKSTGVLNRLVAEAESPQADLFWSGDPVRPLVLIEGGWVEPFRSPAAEGLPDSLRDPEGNWTGFAARARVLLVNTELVPADQRPSSLRELATAPWRGRVAMANPLFGTTTMHMAALSVAWGRGPLQGFLQELRANDLRVASSNGEVKRLVVSGEVAVGLTDTDDAHEALQAGEPVTVVYPDQQGMGTLVMPTTAVLLRGGPHPDAARSLLSCLLSAEVEARMADSAAHMPLRAGVPVPPGVDRVESIRAMEVDYSRVAEEMQQLQPWLREWVGL